MNVYTTFIVWYNILSWFIWKISLHEFYFSFETPDLKFNSSKSFKPSCIWWQWFLFPIIVSSQKWFVSYLCWNYNNQLGTGFFHFYNKQEDANIEEFINKNTLVNANNSFMVSLYFFYCTKYSTCIWKQNICLD